MDKPRFLMCPPDYYEVAYEINPWMSIRRKVDQKEALRQWRDYYDLLTATIGVKVELLEPVAGLPDLVFTANGGLVHGSILVRSNFRHKERRGEEPYFEKWFRKNGYQIKYVDQPFSFEGEGDALLMGEELYTGYHFRSDIEAHDQVAGHIHKSYFGLELCDKSFYHLDTCFAPLDDRSALVHFKAFAPYAQMILWETVPDPIEVPEEEARLFACNAVTAGRSVVLPEGSVKTSEALEKRGFRVYPLNFSEFIKAGGAAKCLVLRI